MAVTSGLVPALRTLRIPRPGRSARRVLFGFALGVLVVLGSLMAFRQAYQDRILPGVRIGDLDVGGLTPAEAQAAAVDAFGRLEAGEIEVRSSRGSAVIAFSDVGRWVDVEAMVERAVAVGRGGSPFDEAIAGLRLLVRPQTMPAVVGFDPARLESALASFARRTHVPAVDAAVSDTPRGYRVERSAEGARLDLRRARQALEAALGDPATASRSVVAADVVAIAPAVGDDDAVRARDAADRIAANLDLSMGPTTWTIKAGAIRSWITFRGTADRYGPVVDATAVPASLAGIEKAVLVKPREAIYLRDRAGRVVGVGASQDGRALDVEATAAAMVEALAGRASGTAASTPVPVTTTVLGPELDTDAATREAPLMVRVGAWTTRYQVGPHNGHGANITIPARRLNGVVVKPGQVFDFWQALGEVSFRTGYRLGGAIVGGHTVEGKALAGGICAASTTLFNAAARGGLEIVSRQPHWYYITRYPLGLDATVSGSQSMRFRNDTKHPILIRGFASPGSVRFEIWTVPNGRTVSWTKPSVRNVVKGYDTVKYTSSLPRGKRLRIEWPVDGKDVSVTRTVRENGRVVHRDTFVSHYHRMVGVTLIGK